MSSLLYILAYVAIIGFVAAVLKKIAGYKKHPMHLRWEIYPVAHEVNGRAAYGGSYLEDAAWWQHKQSSSTIGAAAGFLMEALFLHATFLHNRPLWVRTYPFHVGLYACFAASALTIFYAILALAGVSGGFMTFVYYLTWIANVVGYVGVLFGSIGLIQRRLSDAGLRKYSTPLHYFNLGLFAVWSALGLILIGTMMGTAAAPGASFSYFQGVLSFNFMPLNGLYGLYVLLSCFTFVYIPASFLAHAFMKYFTWHDIRWGDTPTQDSEEIQKQLMANLNLPVSWSADHVKGDGKKTWAEIATTNPTQEQE